MKQTISEIIISSFTERKSEPLESILTPEEMVVRQEKLMIFFFKVYEKKLQDLWIEFEKNKIKPILIKGWASALNYPHPYSRLLGDFDLAVRAPDYEKALALQRKFNFGEVDLHKGLRHLDKLEWNDLFDNSLLIKCGDKAIRILRPEDHLRVLCVHWLGDGGRDKEKLKDIYYAVANRAANFDWHRCLGIVGIKRRRWVIYTIGLAHKYLGLPIEDLEFAEEAKKLPGWLINTVEKEWNNPVEFRYLQDCLGSWDEFIRQLGRRLPPNPIQATINMEGDLDSSTRIFYQFGDFFSRLVPSISRIKRNMMTKFLK